MYVLVIHSFIYDLSRSYAFDILTSIKEPFRPYIEPELIELPL